jgi:O-antigen ligase
LFLGSAVLSTVFAYNVNVAIFGVYTRYDGLLTLVTYLGLFWVAVQSLERPEEVRALVRAAIAGGYVAAAVAIVQSLAGSYTLGTIQPAIGTLGNQNVTGAFLAMLCPLAYFELTAARSWAVRALALNAVIVLGAALVLTFSRSAWLGGAVAAAVLVVAGRSRALRFGLLAALIAVAAVIALTGLLQSSVAAKIEGRVATVSDLAAWGPRPYIWKDSLQVIASRPLIGYGPDNFGLIYPRYQTGEWAMLRSGSELQIDKAHAELLQVAATQGVVGGAAYLLVLAVFVRTYWRGPRDDASTALLAAWAGYQVTVQLNFTALAAAFPFWILAAAAVRTWQPDAGHVDLVILSGSRAMAAAGAAAFLFLSSTLVAGVILPYLADANLRSAVALDFAGRPAAARLPAATAGVLVPYESVYAAERGNLSFELGDWSAARSDYLDATQLGTYNPRLYRNLALADRNLGRRGEALDAARRAVELDRFDPANQALVNQLETGGP